MPALPNEERLKPQKWWLRWVLLGVRVAQILLVAYILRWLSIPLLEEWMPLKNFVVAVGSIILIGKTLFDTLFYDHYIP